MTKTSSTAIGAHFERNGVLAELEPVVPGQQPKRSDLLLETAGGHRAYLELKIPSPTLWFWELQERVRLAAYLEFERQVKKGEEPGYKIEVTGPEDHPMQKADMLRYFRLARQEIRVWAAEERARIDSATAIAEIAEQLHITALPLGDAPRTASRDRRLDLSRIARAAWEKSNDGQLAQADVCVFASDLVRMSEQTRIGLFWSTQWESTVREALCEMPPEVDVVLLSVFDLSGEPWCGLRWVAFSDAGSEFVQALPAVLR